MSDSHDPAWKAAVDAAGATPARLAAAERALAGHDAEPLPAPRIEALVAKAVADRRPTPPAPPLPPRHRLLTATMLVAVIGALAAVGPRWLWPERIASILILDGEAAVLQAMTGATDHDRHAAVAVLDDLVWIALDVLEQAAAGDDPVLAAAAAAGLNDVRVAILGGPVLAATAGDLATLRAIIADTTRSTPERSQAAAQLGRWSALAVHAMRSAALTMAVHSGQRATLLQSVHRRVLPG